MFGLFQHYWSNLETQTNIIKNCFYEENSLHVRSISRKRYVFLEKWFSLLNNIMILKLDMKLCAFWSPYSMNTCSKFVDFIRYLGDLEICQLVLYMGHRERENGSEFEKRSPSKQLWVKTCCDFLFFIWCLIIVWKDKFWYFKI